MLIKDLMTRDPVCCAPSDTIDKVAKLMQQHDCGEIPVCEGRRPVGVITDRDITCRVVAAGHTPSLVPVYDVMTRGVVTIDETAEIAAALELMEDRLVRRLPVVDDEGKIVGIVSQADIIAKAPTLKVARAMRNVSKRTRRHPIAA